LSLAKWDDEVLPDTSEVVNTPHLNHSQSPVLDLGAGVPGVV